MTKELEFLNEVGKDIFHRMEKIKKVEIGKSGAIEKVVTTRSQLTPKQAAEKIEKGTEMPYKGTRTISVDGDHIRTVPDGKKGNNLNPKK